MLFFFKTFIKLGKNSGCALCIHKFGGQLCLPFLWPNTSMIFWMYCLKTLFTCSCSIYIKGKLLNCDWPIVLLSSDIFSVFLSWRNFSLLTYKWLILHNRYSKLLSQLVQGYQIFILQSIKYLWRSNGALYNQFLLEMNVQSHSLITNQQMQKNLLWTDLSF